MSRKVIMPGRYNYTPTPKPGKKYIDGFPELLEALGHALNTMSSIERIREEQGISVLSGEDMIPVPDDVQLETVFYQVLDDAYAAMKSVDLGFLHAMAIMSGIYKEMVTTAEREEQDVASVLLSSRIILNTFSLLVNRFYIDIGLSPEKTDA